MARQLNSLSQYFIFARSEAINSFIYINIGNNADAM